MILCKSEQKSECHNSWYRVEDDSMGSDGISVYTPHSPVKILVLLKLLVVSSYFQMILTPILPRDRDIVRLHRTCTKIAKFSQFMKYFFEGTKNLLGETYNRCQVGIRQASAACHYHLRTWALVKLSLILKLVYNAATFWASRKYKVKADNNGKQHTLNLSKGWQKTLEGEQIVFLPQPLELLKNEGFLVHPLIK